MRAEKSDKNFLKKAKDVLDQNIEELDGATVSRLRKIRYAALEKSDTIEHSWWQRLRLPAVALMTASLIAVVTIVQMRTPVELSPINTVEDIEILASNEQIDLYENFDFYTWLVEEQQNAG